MTILLITLVCIVCIIIVFSVYYTFYVMDTKEEPKVPPNATCAGCGERFKSGDTGVKIMGEDKIMRLAHVGECSDKVLNGFIHGKDK